MINKKVTIPVIFIAMIGILSTGYVSSYFSDSDSYTNTISIKSSSHPTEPYSEPPSETQTEISTEPHTDIGHLVVKPKGAIVDGIVGQGDVISPLEFDVSFIKSDGTEVSLSPGELTAHEDESVRVESNLLPNNPSTERVFKDADAVKILPIEACGDDCNRGTSWLEYFGMGGVDYGYDSYIANHHIATMNEQGNLSSNTDYENYLVVLGNYARVEKSHRIRAYEWTYIRNPNYTVDYIPMYLENADYTVNINTAPNEANKSVEVEILLSEQGKEKINNTCDSTSITLTTDRDRAEVYAYGGEDVQHYVETVIYEDENNVSMEVRGSGKSACWDFSGCVYGSWIDGEYVSNDHWFSNYSYKDIDVPWEVNGDYTAGMPHTDDEATIQAIKNDPKYYTERVQRIKSDITIQDTVEVLCIGHWFLGFNSLESVPKLPDTIKSGDGAFAYCLNLKNVNIDCPNLRNFVHAFRHCPSLGDVVINADYPEMAYAFESARANSVTITAKDMPYNDQLFAFATIIKDITINSDNARLWYMLSEAQVDNVNINVSNAYNAWEFIQEGSKNHWKTLTVNCDKLDNLQEFIREDITIDKVIINAKSACTFGVNEFFCYESVNIGTLDINIGVINNLGNLFTRMSNIDTVNVHIGEVLNIKYGSDIFAGDYNHIMGFARRHSSTDTCIGNFNVCIDKFNGSLDNICNSLCAKDINLEIKEFTSDVNSLSMNNAFADCRNLENAKIVLPKDVSIPMNNCFMGCINLKELELDTTPLEYNNFLKNTPDSLNIFGTCNNIPNILEAK